MVDLINVDIKYDFTFLIHSQSLKTVIMTIQIKHLTAFSPFLFNTKYLRIFLKHY